MPEADAFIAPSDTRPRVLVISTSGLARLVPALGALAAIRAGHDDAKIVLLTSPDVVAFAATAPYFDDIWADDTLGTRDIRRLLQMRRRLTAAPFARVYDLDGTAHTRRLFWLMHGLNALPHRRKNLPWSGSIAGTALFHDDPRRGAMHIVDSWMAQLKAAGVRGVLRSDMSWVARQVTSFTVPFRMAEPFVLLVLDPGPAGPWPVDHYVDLARQIVAEGRVPVLVGVASQPDGPPHAARIIAEAVPGAVDLAAKATINELVFLAWAAKASVGTDNGLMHVTAAAGCHSVVLFDSGSDPALVGQRGDRVIVLRRPVLSDIPVGEVTAALHRDLRPGAARRRPEA